jgi:hypothetical protein
VKSPGCSLSYKLDSFMGKEARSPNTRLRFALAASANIGRRDARRHGPRLHQGGGRGVLGRPEKNGSQPWENPSTGARGTITAIADAYTSDGFQCRDFLASYIRDGAESWLQGDACRIHQGRAQPGSGLRSALRKALVSSGP